jgi:hypothetical protein
VWNGNEGSIPFARSTGRSGSLCGSAAIFNFRIQTGNFSGEIAAEVCDFPKPLN